MESKLSLFLNNLEGGVPERHLAELRAIFSGEIGPEGLAGALASLSARLSGTAPPDPREELSLARDWIAAPDSLARRCWLDRSAPGS